MNINWYPGHMTKARRMMEENIKLVDVVIELLDARAPLSTRNPDIDDLAKNKFRLILLNKSDMADPKDNEKWEAYFNELGLRCVLIDSRNRDSIKNIDKVIKEVCKEKIERDKKRGILKRTLKCMICGIPNVGKSTFINSLCKKGVAKTGNKPGVTKGKQWVNVKGEFDLLDTPGILWPKFEDENIGIRLALIGSVNDDILDITELSYKLIDILKNKYPGVLNSKYDINEDANTIDILNEYTVKRNLLKKGGECDIDRGAALIIDDFRSLRIGRLSIDDIPSI
ncbi:MAG: ribosome biogenesis GTPase YlqF [Lachnospiraceae bacterium]|nr:ribosome biogenesis GTPase YlqF [Lachnospiraceae bacterium]MBP5275614.1 ribosome biogenesis GTPase YlqF [Lachnospiraceae bacterium]